MFLSISCTSCALAIQSASRRESLPGMLELKASDQEAEVTWRCIPAVAAI
jgi:hypothetical protein